MKQTSETPSHSLPTKTTSSQTLREIAPSQTLFICVKLPTLACLSQPKKSLKNFNREVRPIDITPQGDVTDKRLPLLPVNCKGKGQRLGTYI